MLVKRPRPWQIALWSTPLLRVCMMPQTLLVAGRPQSRCMVLRISPCRSAPSSRIVTCSVLPSPMAAGKRHCTQYITSTTRIEIAPTGKRGLGSGAHEVKMCLYVSAGGTKCSETRQDARWSLSHSYSDRVAPYTMYLVGEGVRSCEAGGGKVKINVPDPFCLV